MKFIFDMTEGYLKIGEFLYQIDKIYLDEDGDVIMEMEDFDLNKLKKHAEQGVI